MVIILWQREHGQLQWPVYINGYHAYYLRINSCNSTLEVTYVDMKIWCSAACSMLANASLIFPFHCSASHVVVIDSKNRLIVWTGRWTSATLVGVFKVTATYTVSHHQLFDSQENRTIYNVKDVTPEIFKFAASLPSDTLRGSANCPPLPSAPLDFMIIPCWDVQYVWPPLLPAIMLVGYKFLTANLNWNSL